jgi:hypothetical protein
MQRGNITVRVSHRDWTESAAFRCHRAIEEMPGLRQATDTRSSGAALSCGLFPLPAWR